MKSTNNKNDYRYPRLIFIELLTKRSLLFKEFEIVLLIHTLNVIDTFYLTFYLFILFIYSIYVRVFI